MSKGFWILLSWIFESPNYDTRWTMTIWWNWSPFLGIGQFMRMAGNNPLKKSWSCNSGLSSSVVFILVWKVGLIIMILCCHTDLNGSLHFHHVFSKVWWVCSFPMCFFCIGDLSRRHENHRFHPELMVLVFVRTSDCRPCPPLHKTKDCIALPPKQMVVRPTRASDFRVVFVALLEVILCDFFVESNLNILLIEEILHQLRLVVYPIIYKLFLINPRWCRISSINNTWRSCT